MAKRLADWLIEQGEHLVYTEEKITYDYIRQINPDYLISYNYKYLISKDILDFLNGNAINLHISYLPYGRGSYPIVWNILENNPLGVTIHYIDEGIDTGDIIVQKEVLIDKDKETLRTAYEILHKEIQQLFKDNWQRIKNKEIFPLKQSYCGGGQYITIKSLNSLDLLLRKKVGIPQSKNLKNTFSLRLATEDDLEDLFYWINNPNVTKMSFTNRAITFEEHKKWFESKLKDNKTIIYIAQIKDQKIGCFRVEQKDMNYYVSVVLNPNYIGKGFGKELIFRASEKIMEEKAIDCLIAEIKYDNIPSVKAFESAGYKLYKLVYKYDKKHE